MKLYVLDLGKIIMMGDNPVTDSAQSGTEPLSIPIHAFLVDSPIGYIPVSYTHLTLPTILLV